jgi:diacylglycerol kinase
VASTKNKQTFLKAVINAFNGLFHFLLHERNGKIQLSVAILTVIAAIFFKVSASEWLLILFCIAIVISLEILNSAVEKLCDMVEANYHPVIKTIKDIAAGAVLWSAIISAIIGCIIFLPKIISLFI